MQDTIVLYPVRGQGYAFAISFPKALVEGFKELFPRQDDRAWQDPLWCFKRSSLSRVRTWAAQQAQEHLLTLYDLTEVRKAKRELFLAEIWQHEYEEHVAAMVEVLPLLPAEALRLSYWWPTHLLLDLQTYLERPLFDQLKQAALPSGKVPRTTYIPLPRSNESRISAASDPRIVRALMDSRVRNFNVRALSLVQTFDNGTAHFNDQDERLWFGAPYRQVIGAPFDFTAKAAHALALPYTVTKGEEEDSIYLVAQADAYLQGYCLSVAPAMVSAMSPQPSSELLAELLQQYHLEAWSQAGVSELCSVPAEVLTPLPGSSHTDLWRDSRSWIHPADALLHYLRLSEREALLLLLGWEEERFQVAVDQVQQLKTQRAQAYYHYCEAHAVALMQEHLRRLQRAEIQELAARYGISMPLSPKEKMVQTCTDARMAADLIGLTEERQRRHESAVAFTDGIPWGKRTAGALYESLQRGYLSDGTWSLGCLKGEGASAWYALWEGWPPRVERARNQWSPFAFIEQAGIDLLSCRWFAYPRGEVPIAECV